MSSNCQAIPEILKPIVDPHGLEFQLLDGVAEGACRGTNAVLGGTASDRAFQNQDGIQSLAQFFDLGRNLAEMSTEFTDDGIDSRLFINIGASFGKGLGSADSNAR